MKKLAKRLFSVGLIVVLMASGTYPSFSGEVLDPPPLAPATPTGVSASSTEDSVTITWSSTENASGYEVKFNGVTSPTVTSTSKTYSGLDPSTDYTYSVRASGDGGVSDYSTGQTITTKTPLPDPPGIPTGLSASASESSVTISWDSMPRADEYDVFFDGSTTRTDSSSITFDGLTDNTSYTYRVQAINAGGESGYTSDRTITTDEIVIPAPQVPTGISASSTERSVTISWTAVEGASGYDVDFNDVISSVTANTVSFDELEPSTEYSYQVRALGQGGSSSFSDVKTITTKTPQPQPPMTPTGLTGNLVETSLTVTWNSVNQASGYRIDFDGNIQETSETSMIYTDLSPGSTYSFKVLAFNDDGDSSYSSSETVYIPDPPSIPSDLNGEAAQRSLSLSWTAVSNALEYDVNISGQGLDITQTVTGTSASFDNLEASTSYLVKVRSSNDDGKSAYSTGLTLTTQGELPAIPSGLSYSATESSLTLSWQGSEDSDAYDVYFDGQVSQVTATSITFSDLEANSSYSFKVRAINEAGQGSYTELLTGQTLQYMPSIPGNISADASEYTVTVTWDMDAYGDAYILEFDGETYTSEGSFYTVTDLEPYTLYQYRVKEVNQRGTSDYSPVKSVRTMQILPGIPTDIKAKATSSSVTITWQAVDRAVSYDISFGGKTYSTEDTSYKLTGLSSDRSFDFAVRAVNQAGNGSYSDFISVRTDGVSPSKPFNVEATATDTTVSISWSSSHFAEGFEIFFDGKAYTTKNTSKTFTGLKSGVEHVFKLRSFNEFGSSIYTQEESIFTDEPTAQVLSIPIGMVTTAEETSIKVSWEEVSGASSYEISANGDIVVTRSTEYSFTGLSPNTNYEIMVRAVNSEGNSNFSDIRTVKTLLALPDIPSGISFSSTENQLALSWVQVEEADSYDILFAGETYSTTETSYTISQVEAGKSYQLQVRAVNQRGPGQYSKPLIVNTAKTLPTAPDIDSLVASSTSLKVNWSEVSGANSYELNIQGRIIAVDGRSYTVYGLSAATDYTISVRAINGAGKGPYSSSRKVTTKKGVAVIKLLEPVNPEAINIYYDEVLSIRWEALASGVIYSYVLSDEEGGVIISGSTKDQHIDVDSNRLTMSKLQLALSATDSEGDIIGRRTSYFFLQHGLKDLQPNSGQVDLNTLGNVEIVFQGLPFKQVEYKLTLVNILTEQVMAEVSSDQAKFMVDGDLFIDDISNVRATVTASFEGQIIASDYSEFSVISKIPRLIKPEINNLKETTTLLVNSDLTIEWNEKGDIVPDYYTVNVYQDGVKHHEEEVTKTDQIDLSGDLFKKEGRFVISLIGHKAGFEDSPAELKIIKVMGSKTVEVTTGVYEISGSDSANIYGNILIVDKNRLKEFGFLIGEDQQAQNELKLTTLNSEGIIRYHVSSLEAGKKYYYRAYVKEIDGSYTYGQLFSFIQPESIELVPDIISVDVQEGEKTGDYTYQVITSADTEALVIINDQGIKMTYHDLYVDFDDKKIWTVTRLFRHPGAYQDMIYGLSNGILSDGLAVSVLVGQSDNPVPILELYKDSYEMFLGSHKQFMIKGNITGLDQDKLIKIRYTIDINGQNHEIVSKDFNAISVELEDNSLMIDGNNKLFEQVGKYLIRVQVLTESTSPDQWMTLGSIILEVKDRVVLQGIDEVINVFGDQHEVNMIGEVKCMDGNRIDQVSIVNGQKEVVAYSKPIFGLGRSSVVNINETLELEFSKTEVRNLAVLVRLEDGSVISKEIAVKKGQLYVEIPKLIKVGSLFIPRLYELDEKDELVLINDNFNISLSGSGLSLQKDGSIKVVSSDYSVLTVTYMVNGVSYKIDKKVIVED